VRRALLILALLILSAVAIVHARASGTGPLGYVGCSNTALSVKGYYAVGGTRFWPFNRGYWSPHSLVLPPPRC
jgi:hypothetical protein